MTKKGKELYKDLSVLHQDVSCVLAVDFRDDFILQKENFVRLSPFRRFDKNDTALRDLAEFLKASVDPSDNVLDMTDVAHEYGLGFKSA